MNEVVEARAQAFERAADLLRSGAEPVIVLRVVPYRRAKRAFDVVASLAFILVFWWLYVLIAILVGLTSPGPILFRQTRVGLGGTHFSFLKFRSMIPDAESHRDALQELNEQVGPVFKIRNDPRVTPVGRVLRKFSLDELPQFLNVVMGDMSLVGPRPPLPEEVAQYEAWQLQRLSVTPGITCQWQISGRSNIDFHRWVEMDLEYIETMSFWTDLKILLRTFPVVITGRGAC